MERHGDSDDGDDAIAMTYFLPNGIADDSPPKRSTLQASTSFGPIGAARAFASSSNAGGGGGWASGPAEPLSASSSTASAAAAFRLADLGGEAIVGDTGRARRLGGVGLASSPAASATTSGAFGDVGGAFSGAFGPRGERDTPALVPPRRRSPPSLFDPIGDVVPTTSGFRADAEPFRPSTQAFGFGRGSSTTAAAASAATTPGPPGVTSCSSPYASAGAVGTWGATKAPPRRAPPGLSMPPVADDRVPEAAFLPPGLLGDHPRGLRGDSPFGAFSTTTSAAAGTSAVASSSNAAASGGSVFTGGGFGSRTLAPFAIPSTDPFLAVASSQGHEDGRVFNTELAELNAKSISVDEAQSSLEATAIAAAHDVVEGIPAAVRPERESRRSAKSPRSDGSRSRLVPATADERRRSDGRSRASTTPSRRHGNEHVPTDQSGERENSRMPTTTKSGAVQSAGVKSGTILSATGTAAKSAGPLHHDGSESKSSRRGRNVHPPSAGARGSASTSRDAPTVEVSTRRKQPSSVSSTGSDEQPTPVQTVSVTTGPSVVAKPSKSRESPSESRSATRSGTVNKKAPRSADRNQDVTSQSVTTSGGSVLAGPAKRQVYRQKYPREASKEVLKTADGGDVSPGGSDADASGADSTVDDAVSEPNKKIHRNDAKETTVPHGAAKASRRRGKTVDAPAGTDHAEKASVPVSNDRKILTPSTPASAAMPLSSSQASSALVDGDKTTSAALQSTSLASADIPTKTSCTDSLPETRNDVTSTLASDHSGSQHPAAGEVQVETTQLLPLNSSLATVDTVGLNNSNRNASERSPVVMADSPTTASSHGSDRKVSTKENKKEKHKKEKGEKKRGTHGKLKKEKRESSSSGKGDMFDEQTLEDVGIVHSNKPFVLMSLVSSGITAIHNVFRLTWRTTVMMLTMLVTAISQGADWINLKGIVGGAFAYLESILAVVFSVVLLLSLHGASWFIRIHRVAFRAVLTYRHIGFCFAFLYAFPFLVQYVFPWAPPWAPVCLWYAFLVQLFCTNGSTAMVTSFRIILPLVFLVEGISHHSFLLDLNGAELLLVSFILSALKTSNLFSPIFLISLAGQCLSAVFLGSELVVQWFQMALALYSLHSMAATHDDWSGLGEDDDLTCQSMSMHHSIADYNYHPAPSVPSIQKTKRLDRRALAYVRGRKLR